MFWIILLRFNTFFFCQTDLNYVNCCRHITFVFSCLFCKIKQPTCCTQLIGFVTSAQRGQKHLAQKFFFLY